MMFGLVVSSVIVLAVFVTFTVRVIEEMLENFFIFISSGLLPLFFHLIIEGFFVIFTHFIKVFAFLSFNKFSNSFLDLSLGVFIKILEFLMRFVHVFIRHTHFAKGTSNFVFTWMVHITHIMMPM